MRIRNGRLARDAMSVFRLAESKLSSQRSNKCGNQAGPTPAFANAAGWHHSRGFRYFSSTARPFQRKREKPGAPGAVLTGNQDDTGQRPALAKTKSTTNLQLNAL